MSYRGYNTGGGFFGFPPVISQLVLVNAVVFLAQPLFLDQFLDKGLALVPRHVVQRGMLWELVTYMFLHGGFMHVFFNMIGLVIFGSELERGWGSRGFLKYYFVTGIGAGIVQVITSYVTGNPNTLVIGASGAVYGLILAFAMAFPQRTLVLFPFMIPVAARTMAIIYAFIALVSGLSGGGDRVAHFAHLGGMLVGYLYLRWEAFSWKGKRWIHQVRHSVAAQSERRSAEKDEKLQEEVDRILDKIKHEGMGALSTEEKRILAESAERARRRQRGDL